MKLTATLIKNVIPAGSSIDDPDHVARNSNTEAMYAKMIERLRILAIRDGIQSSLDKQAFKRGTSVEVLGIRDGLSNQHLYATPNLPGIVADIRGQNWNGEIVETCVSIESLDLGTLFDKSEKSRPEDILEAFAKWQTIKDAQ